jgi:hypothetical protein
MVHHWIVASSEMAEDRPRKTNEEIRFKLVREEIFYSIREVVEDFLGKFLR